MVGLAVFLFYALVLFFFGNYWQEIYFCSTLFLFKWYFISSMVMLLMLLPLAIILSGSFGFLAFAYKTAEMIIAWIGVTINSAHSLLRFFLKRLAYIVGAYYLHSALVFDETKMSAYYWDKEYLAAGAALLLIVLLFLTQKPNLNFKLRKTSSPKENV